ncbi:c-type cytochrome [Sphingomonas sp. MMS12-HWE2-04]|uniref:c-type cytochrome n=1 Tax=Sphingomonas sp. MMS12-HWE2-04 TaxID=3234199 RepID=UPI00384E1E4D
MFFVGAVLLTGAVALARASDGPGHDGTPPPASPKLGRPASADAIRRMEISIAANGAGLPPGSGSVADGQTTYESKCAACHGPAGSGGIADRLTGGIGSLTSAKPVKTVASYWPYAPPLFDYIRRAMPLTAPQSLGDGEVYSLVAYLLSIDGIVARDARLDGASLSRVRMPNRNGFVSLENQRFDGNIERPEPHRSN